MRYFLACLLLMPFCANAQNFQFVVAKGGTIVFVVNTANGAVAHCQIELGTTTPILCGGGTPPLSNDPVGTYQFAATNAVGAGVLMNTKTGAVSYCTVEPTTGVRCVRP